MSVKTQVFCIQDENKTHQLVIGHRFWKATRRTRISKVKPDQ